MEYRYHIKPLAVQKIRSFYRNVLINYPNTYSYGDMLRYINDTVDAIYGIEQSLLRRRPTIKRWQNWHMAHAGNWYYAYMEAKVAAFTILQYINLLNHRPIGQVKYALF